MSSITSPFSITSFNPSSSSFPFHITMNLDANSLESLHQSTFTNLRNLVSFPLPTPSSLFLVPFLPSLMNLNSNQLTSLPPDIFYNNINLKSLSILISFHSSSHSHSLHSFNSNRLTFLPNGVFSQLTSLISLPSSLPSILISLPHLCYLNSNSLTHIDMGNITPSYMFVSIIPPHIIVVIHLTLVTFNQTILSHSIMMIMSSNTTHSG